MAPRPERVTVMPGSPSFSGGSADGCEPPNLREPIRDPGVIIAVAAPNSFSLPKALGRYGVS
jgi:hypothetical protein